MADEEGAGSFANQLEESSMVRSRFRRKQSWLQWPILSPSEEGEVELHPICTASLLLNVDAVRRMVDYYHGDFVDIHQLTDEAPKHKSQVKNFCVLSHLVSHHMHGFYKS